MDPIPPPLAVPAVKRRVRPEKDWEAKLAGLRRAGLWRSMREIQSSQGPEVNLNGRKVVMLCSNNYLGLAGHPALRSAAIRAVERYGVGSSGARLISGAMSPHKQLEERLAAFKRAPAALVYNSGYHANLGLLQALTGPDDVVFSDELNHASIIDGCRLSRARIMVYRHGDMDHLESLLRRVRTKKKLVVTDTVFGMDGDLAHLPELVHLSEHHGARLMVDEAHATGVFGPRGGGLAEEFGLQHRIPIQMGTLGKALGCFGAYVAGSRALIDLLINTSRSFIFTTALPPAVCAAAIAAIDLVEKGTALRERLWSRVRQYTRGLTALGVDAQPQSPILPIVLGENARVMRTCESLLGRGVFAQGIRYPTVPKGTARLRTSLMATHTRDHIRTVLTALKAVLNQA
ncbi:MAG: 8-amino-7-oxononanoate synthase [Nitrospirae bacterium]|nr:8-amino-7-oxononanoate synthase [Nitrospirota bacterium]